MELRDARPGHGHLPCPSLVRSLPVAALVPYRTGDFGTGLRTIQGSSSATTSLAEPANPPQRNTRNRSRAEGVALGVSFSAVSHPSERTRSFATPRPPAPRSANPSTPWPHAGVGHGSSASPVEAEEEDEVQIVHFSAFRVSENGSNKPCARHDSNVRPLPAARGAGAAGLRCTLYPGDDRAIRDALCVRISPRSTSR